MIKQKGYHNIEISDIGEKSILMTQNKIHIVIIERENLQQLIDELTEIQNQSLNKILDK